MALSTEQTETALGLVDMEIDRVVVIIEKYRDRLRDDPSHEGYPRQIRAHEEYRQELRQLRAALAVG